jgi:hypothetical protein
MVVEEEKVKTLDNKMKIYILLGFFLIGKSIFSQKKTLALDSILTTNKVAKFKISQDVNKIKFEYCFGLNYKMILSNDTFVTFTNQNNAIYSKIIFGANISNSFFNQIDSINNVSKITLMQMKLLDSQFFTSTSYQPIYILNSNTSILTQSFISTGIVNSIYCSKFTVNAIQIYSCVQTISGEYFITFKISRINRRLYKIQVKSFKNDGGFNKLTLYCKRSLFSKKVKIKQIDDKNLWTELK